MSFFLNDDFLLAIQLEEDDLCPVSEDNLSVDVSDFRFPHVRIWRIHSMNAADFPFVSGKLLVDDHHHISHFQVFSSFLPFSSIVECGEILLVPQLPKVVGPRLYPFPGRAKAAGLWVGCDRNDDRR